MYGMALSYCLVMLNSSVPLSFAASVIIVYHYEQFTQTRTAFASLTQDHIISLLFHETTLLDNCLDSLHTVTSSQPFLIPLSREHLLHELHGIRYT